ncbi:Arc-like DNA binding domain protein [compost metagenome]
MKKAAKVQTVLRLPEQMREWLCEQADINGRTINGEVVFRLKRMMEQEQQDGQKQRA